MVLTRCYSSMWLLWGWGGLTTPVIDCVSAFDLWGPSSGSLLIGCLGKIWFFLPFLFPVQLPAGNLSDPGPTLDMLGDLSGGDPYFVSTMSSIQDPFPKNPCQQQLTHFLSYLAISSPVAQNSSYLRTKDKKTKLSKCSSLSIQAQKPVIWLFGCLMPWFKLSIEPLAVLWPSAQWEKVTVLEEVWGKWTQQSVLHNIPQHMNWAQPNSFP